MTVFTHPPGGTIQRFEPEALRYQRPGDLVFSTGHGPKAATLRFLQRVRDSAPAMFSHVAVCVYPGLFIHSVPRGGVQLVNFEDRHGIDFGPHEPRRFAVVRLPDLAIDVEDVLRVITYWTGQKYNFRLASRVSAPPGQVFCSQLVVQILDRAGVRWPGLAPGQPITPSALHRLAMDRGGEDVSDSYADYAARLSAFAKEHWRLKNDPVRMAIRRAAQHTLLLSTAEAQVLIMTNVLNASTVESVLESANVLGKLPTPERDQFEQDCHDLGFVLAQAAQLITEPAPVIAPRHWMLERDNTVEGIRAMSAAIFIAHIRRVREMVQALAEEARWVARTAMLLVEVPPPDARRAAALVDGMERLIHPRTGLGDLPLAGQLSAMPVPHASLAGAGDIKAVVAEVEVLRLAWNEMANHDRVALQVLADARHVWPCEASKPAAIEPATAITKDAASVD